MNTTGGEYNDKKIISPWNQKNNQNFYFPIEEYEKLIEYLGWEIIDFKEYWESKNGALFVHEIWPSETKPDWIWGIAIPILSNIIKKICDDKRKIIGISALPGCGKTSLGYWLEKAAKNLNYRVKVISLDDFYLPSEQMEIAMKGNPWNVPRGLPGSHSIKELYSSIHGWIDTGIISAPKFDKSLRGGKGDRSEWIKDQVDLIVLEGWFLGCKPLTNYSYLCTKSITEIDLDISLKEYEYRLKVQEQLKKYTPIWDYLDMIWHVKSTDIKATVNWKINQEKNMFIEKGSSLAGKELDLFLRMIRTSIPEESLSDINCNAIVEIDSGRRVLWAGIKQRLSLE